MMLRRRLVAMVTAGALMVSGCASTKPVRLLTSAERPFGPVEAGDAVLAHMRDGGTARFVIARIDGEALIATDGRRYDRSNLLSLRRNSSTGRKTATIIAIVAGAAVAVVLLVGWWLGENTR